MAFVFTVNVIIHTATPHVNLLGHCPSVETIILVLRHHYSNVKLGVDFWILPLFFWYQTEDKHTHLTPYQIS